MRKRSRAVVVPADPFVTDLGQHRIEGRSFQWGKGGAKRAWPLLSLPCF